MPTIGTPGESCNQGVTLHPHVRRFLTTSPAAPPLDTRSVEDNRAHLAQVVPLTGDPASVDHVTDTRIADVPVRDYVPAVPAFPAVPAAAGPLPCVVYFHGGGWVTGDLDLADTTVRALATGAGAVSVSVDYRLAPEHPFPAAVDDALAVVGAVLAGDTGLRIDTGRVAVAGDSAGGNLAAVVAQQLRGHSPALVHQALFYPVTDASTTDTDSYRAFGEGHGLSTRDMEWFIGHYAGTADRRDPRLSPLHNPDLTGLPPATIITAGCDPLASEGRAYGRALVKAGTRASVIEFPGQMHAFLDLGALLDDALTARRLVAGELRAAFA